jgi:hypothetical protein
MYKKVKINTPKPIKTSNTKLYVNIYKELITICNTEYKTKDIKLELLTQLLLKVDTMEPCLSRKKAIQTIQKKIDILEK